MRQSEALLYNQRMARLFSKLSRMDNQLDEHRIACQEETAYYARRARELMGVDEASSRAFWIQTATKEKDN